MAEILIIDDDIELCNLLTDFLSREGFSCSFEHTGNSGLERIREQRFELVILDVMLPGMDGMETLRKIRLASEVPVIMLTARGEESDRITGLELGADDYLPKPFNPRELSARIKAILRRFQNDRTGTRDHEVLESEGIKLDSSTRTLYLNDKPQKITSIEFDFLAVLMKHAGEIVTRETLSEEVLDREFSPLDRSIDVHIGQLRRKIGPRNNGDQRIKTVRGTGYIFGLG